MKKYQICYDLRAPGRNYEELYKAIRSYGHWAHPLESTWIIQTTQTASEIAKYLRQFMDANDGLIVTGWNGEAAWFNVNSEAGDWMKRAA
jgi:hypothetical protein